MDAVIEKAVEMGVHTIQPFYSDHSFLRQEGSISENKIDRWKKIIISATQQSGRGDLLTLAPAVHLKELLGQLLRPLILLPQINKLTLPPYLWVYSVMKAWLTAGA
jgi:16S rRNA (uracil1498-N3)-methyltransferase